jgi:hypothetical protein
VFCAQPDLPPQAALRASAQLTETLLHRLADPDTGEALRHQLAATAAERIGEPGGSQRLTAAIMALLSGADG